MVATGSEVALAEAAAAILETEGRSIRVVSIPSVEIFLSQDAAYLDEVLGTGLPVASIEAGVTTGWERFTGRDGLRIGIDHFGASAPADVIAKELGFTPDAVAGRIRAWLARS